MVVVVVVDVVAAVVVAAVVADRRAVPVILVFDFGENILCSERPIHIRITFTSALSIYLFTLCSLIY